VLAPVILPKFALPRVVFEVLKPRLRRKQFGGVLRGPVVRDKTIFMASYEGLRESRQSAGTNDDAMLFNFNDYWGDNSMSSWVRMPPPQ
jgi:hypothetical protein